MKRKIKSWDNSKRYPRFTGRGDYKTTLRNIGKAVQTVGRVMVPAGTFAKLGGAAGTGIGGYMSGSPYGAAAGGWLGGTAGDKFAQLVGFGDYSVKANSLMDLPMGQPVASFGNMSNATVVKHREFIQNVLVPAVPADFSVQVLSLNPALRAVFPWLSSMAASYQEYQFIGAVFEFRSLASSSATTLALGSVAIASNYDTADPNFPDKRHMENSQFCVSGKPSDNLIHPIECDPKITFSPLKFTRTGARAANTDSRLYDHCNVHIATEGLPGTANTIIGELWVTYEVALYKPQLGAVIALRDHYHGTTATCGAINTANPLGLTAAALSPRGGTSHGLGITLGAAGAITFPAGTAPGLYEVSIQWIGPAGFCTVAGSFVAAGTVLVKTYYQNATSSEIDAPAPAAAGSVSQSVICMLQIANPLIVANTVTITQTFGGADATSYDLQVAAVPSTQT